jgi:uncharacterized protein (TIGR03382 family)
VLNGAQVPDFVLAGGCAADVTVSPGGSCAIDIGFHPAVAGQRAATMMLVTDGGSQFTVSLAGTGLAVPVPMLAVNPQAFDFGSADVNGAAPAHRITVTNAGGNPAVLTGVTFAGPFSLQADSGACAAVPFTLQPGAGCDLVVRFTPAASGDASGSMVLAADAGNPLTVALSGKGKVPVVQVPAAPQNNGGSGCSAATSGNDPMLALLVALSVAVLGWRRFIRKQGRQA